MASFVGLKQAGDGLLDYMMKHRPKVPDEDELLSQGLHDLEELFPGIYKDGHKRYRTSGDAVTSEAMDAINAVRGKPAAEVDIFRAVPKGVRDINTGDWVTTSKSYAHKHGGHALNDDYDIITGKAKASDLYNPGDSIAEMGFWGMPMKGAVTRALPLAAGVTGGLLAMSPEEAEAAVSPTFKTDFIKAFTDAKRIREENPAAKAKKLLARHEDVVLGETPQQAYEQLKELFPQLTDPVAQIAFPHGLESREWEPEQMIRLFSDAFEDEGLTAARNMPGNNRSPAIFWQQGKEQSGFFPVIEKDGHPLILTGMPKNTSEIQKYLLKNRWGLGGRALDPSIQTPTLQNLGLEIPDGQPTRLSAVNPRPVNTIRGLDDWSKRNLPKVTGAATGAAIPYLSPTETESAPYVFPADRPGYVNPEPGLGSPVVDPVDVLLAPIGAVGAGAKAAAMAAEPFLAYGTDKAVGGLLDWWEGD